MAEYARILGIKETVAALRALPPKFGSNGGGPIRKALAAAAAVIRDAIRDRAPVLTGNIRANVYMYRNRNPGSRGVTEHYKVGVRVGRGRRADTRLARGLRRVGRRFASTRGAWYWWLLEFGFQHVGGKRVQIMFARPAFESHKYPALRVLTEVLRNSVASAVAAARAEAGA